MHISVPRNTYFSEFASHSGGCGIENAHWKITNECSKSSFELFDIESKYSSIIFSCLVYVGCYKSHHAELQESKGLKYREFVILNHFSWIMKVTCRDCTAIPGAASTWYFCRFFHLHLFLLEGSRYMLNDAH